MITSARLAGLGTFITLAALPFGARALELRSAMLHYEHTAYSAHRGERDVSRLDVAMKAGRHTLELGLAQGRRDFGGDVHHGERVSILGHHHWSKRWSGRSIVAYGSDDAVFSNREVGHQVNYKLRSNVVVHGGARWSAYEGDVEAVAWHGGASIYQGRWMASYRYTHYDLSDRNDGGSHLVSLRRRDADGTGATQLWLGRGTSAFAYAAGPELRDSRSRTVSLRRVQPLNDSVRLDATIGRAWHDSPFQRYRGTTGRIGVSYHW